MAVEPNEERIRKKIMQAFGREVKGLPNILRQPEINKIVGKSSVRAPYLKALLETMQEERLVDRHWRNWVSGDQPGGTYWSLFDHPDNVLARAQREIWRKELEEIERIDEERNRQWQIENAPRLAREKFQKDLSEFLVDNYDELFQVFRRIYQQHTRKTPWIFSRQ